VEADEFVGAVAHVGDGVAGPGLAVVDGDDLKRGEVRDFVGGDDDGAEGEEGIDGLGAGEV